MDDTKRRHTQRGMRCSFPQSSSQAVQRRQRRGGFACRQLVFFPAHTRAWLQHISGGRWRAPARHTRGPPKPHTPQHVPHSTLLNATLTHATLTHSCPPTHHAPRALPACPVLLLYLHFYTTYNYVEPRVACNFRKIKSPP